MTQALVPQVAVEETKRFASQWTYKGLAVPMDDVHVQFATDFANVVLLNFIQVCQQQVAAQQAAQTPETPKPETSLIVEG